MDRKATYAAVPVTGTSSTSSELIVLTVISYPKGLTLSEVQLLAGQMLRQAIVARETRIDHGDRRISFVGVPQEWNRGKARALAAVALDPSLDFWKEQSKECRPVPFAASGGPIDMDNKRRRRRTARV